MRFLLSVLFATLAFTSCKQDEDGGPTPTADVHAHVVGPIFVTQGDSDYSDVMVRSLNEIQAGAKIAVSGLPAGVSVRLEPDSGTTPFNSFIYVTAAPTAVRGSYPVTITATPPSGPEKSFEFDIKVEGHILYSQAGTYQVTNDCLSGTTYTSTISVDPTTPGRILVSNFHNSGATVYVSMNPQFTHLLEIPQQAPAASGFTVSGTGHFIDSKLTLDYHILASGGHASTCRATYIH